MPGLTGSRSTVPFLITRWGKVESERSSRRPVSWLKSVFPTSQVPSCPTGHVVVLRQWFLPSRRVPLKLAAPGSPSPGMPSLLFLDIAAAGRAPMLLLPPRLSWASVVGATRNPPIPSKRATSHLHTCRVIYKFDPISPQIPSACCGGGDAGCTPSPPQLPLPTAPHRRGQRDDTAVQSGAWVAGAEGGRAPARGVQICCSPGSRSHSHKSFHGGSPGSQRRRSLGATLQGRGGLAGRDCRTMPGASLAVLGLGRCLQSCPKLSRGGAWEQGRTRVEGTESSSDTHHFRGLPRGSWCIPGAFWLLGTQREAGLTERSPNSRRQGSPGSGDSHGGLEPAVLEPRLPRPSLQVSDPDPRGPGLSCSAPLGGQDEGGTQHVTGV